LKIRIAWVKAGGGRSPHIEALAEDYAKRIGHYSPIELADYKSEEALLLGQQKEKNKNPRAVLVLLERTGKKLTSFDLSEFIREQRELQASTVLTFAIGRPMDSLSLPGMQLTLSSPSVPSPCRTIWHAWCCWSRCTARSPSCTGIRIMRDINVRCVM